jgi:hypothetical protein
MWTWNASFSLGPAQTGLTLRAALVDTTNALIAKDLATGFTEQTRGNYQWAYASMPDGFRGAVAFYTGTVGAGTNLSGVTELLQIGIGADDEAAAKAGTAGDSFVIEGDDVEVA